MPWTRILILWNNLRPRMLLLNSVTLSPNSVKWIYFKRSRTILRKQSRWHGGKHPMQHRMSCKQQRNVRWLRNSAGISGSIVSGRYRSAYTWSSCKLPILWLLQQLWPGSAIPRHQNTKHYQLPNLLWSPRLRLFHPRRQ